MAVRLIGMLFSGKPLTLSKPDRTDTMAENIFVWRKSFSRFGVEFFMRFSSLSLSDQVNARGAT